MLTAMDDARLAYAVTRALAKLMIRKGVLEHNDILEAADDAADGGAEGEAVAHDLRCLLLEAAAPTQAEWLADRARRRFRVVPKAPD